MSTVTRTLTENFQAPQPPLQARILDVQESFRSLLADMQNSALFSFEEELLEEIRTETDMATSLRRLLVLVIDASDKDSVLEFEGRALEMLEGVLSFGVEVADFLQGPLSCKDRIRLLFNSMKKCNAFSAKTKEIIRVCEKKIHFSTYEKEVVLILCHLISVTSPESTEFEGDLFNSMQDILPFQKAEEVFESFQTKIAKRSCEKAKAQSLAKQKELLEEEGVKALQKLRLEAFGAAQKLQKQTDSSIERLGGIIEQRQKMIVSELHGQVDETTTKVEKTWEELKKVVDDVKVICSKTEESNEDMQNLFASIESSLEELL